MIDFMGDNLYELELYVPAASLLWLPDGAGVDTITVLAAHPQTVEITLSHYTWTNGEAYAAMARYFGADGIWHQMVIQGVVEHATGSPGADRITGNHLGNRLWGEADPAGLGGPDTIHGGLGHDTLQGCAGNDVLSGGEDNDLLFGGRGADLLLGGSGRDTLLGGAGADTLDGGGDVGDMLSYAISAAPVQVSLAANGFATLSGGDAQGDLAQGFRNLLGSEFADILVDSDKVDLPGGANANAFYGGGGGDTMDLGGGNDTAQGGLGNDVIRGEGGADQLFGGLGADRLTGGEAADILSGGGGADVFVYLRLSESSPQPGGRDRITDFDAASGDRINLSALDADRNLAGNQAFHLVAGGLTGQAGELALLPSGADTLLLADTDGNGAADFAILLQGITAPGAEAFFL